MKKKVKVHTKTKIAKDIKNNNEPLVSVIIPVYNSEKYLPRCLDSVAEQTYNNLEIIVVNNASEGNVLEIVDTYKRMYPERDWHVVTHKKNQGLFKARISGVEASRGDYIAFIDSDDRISCDFYRLLVNCAEINGCDLVAGDVYYELEDGSLYRSNLATQELYPNEIPSDDLLLLFYSCEGKCYSWHTVWNKIYARALWRQAYPYLKKITDHIVMCEDYLFTTVFFAFAHKYHIRHGVHYYYYKCNDAYTSRNASIDKIEKNISDLQTVFRAAKIFLTSINRYDELKDHFEKFVERYYRIWFSNIDSYDLPYVQKKYLHKLLDKSIPIPKYLRTDTQVAREDSYSMSLTTPLYDRLEYTKRLLKSDDIEYVSFDIFDTLILRPLFTPQDLFKFLDLKFQKLTASSPFDSLFSKMRIQAETEARKKLQAAYASYQEITLDEIYAQLSEIYGIPNDLIAKMKEEEISLELNFCQPRQTAKELYELAQYLGKKIIYISDMYLSSNIIKKMLDKCGYSTACALFLSSEVRLTKHTGDLYRHVLKTLEISSKSSVLHIGDNLQSDYIRAEKCGLTAIHYPRPVDVFSGANPSLYNAKFYSEAFRTDYGARFDSALTFLAVRCMLAIVANKLFDNPYIEIQPVSHLNASPYQIGYATMGMYILGLACWLNENTQDYKRIHFIARDSYLVRQAFSILFPDRESDYLYVSRKALMPLMINSPKDFLKLTEVIRGTSVSPRNVFQLLSPILPATFDQEAFCQSNKILCDNRFSSNSEFDNFLAILQRIAYDPQRISTYRTSMREYFSRIIGEMEATFDVGYSGRTEKVLGNLLNKRLDAFYVHINNDQALTNSLLAHFKITSFFAGTPLITGPVRELLMSEIGPSCVGYAKDEKNEFHLMFEERPDQYPQDIILSIIHKGALDFVQEYVNTFQKYLPDMPFRYQDAAIPFEFFLSQSSEFDRWIFRIFDFEDDLFMGEKVTLYDFWNMQISDAHTARLTAPATDFSYLPMWKKAVIYALTDRKMLKEKVRGKYARHPVLLQIMKICYSIPRSIYHLFKR